MTLNLSRRESEALTKLAAKKELTKAGVIRQALRLYQLVSEREMQLIDPRAPSKRIHPFIL